MYLILNCKSSYIIVIHHLTLTFRWNYYPRKNTTHKHTKKPRKLWQNWKRSAGAQKAVHGRLSRGSIIHEGKFLLFVLNISLMVISNVQGWAGKILSKQVGLEVETTITSQCFALVSRTIKSCYRHIEILLMVLRYFEHQTLSMSKFFQETLSMSKYFQEKLFTFSVYICCSAAGLRSLWRVHLTWLRARWWSTATGSTTPTTRRARTPSRTSTPTTRRQTPPRTSTRTIDNWTFFTSCQVIPD